MNKRIKKEWVEKLMSGKYKQQRGGMYGYHSPNNEKPTHHCCLAVLETCLKDKNSQGIGVLTSAQLKEAGLDSEEQLQLVALNDMIIGGQLEGVPFPVIAGFIKENL